MEDFLEEIIGISVWSIAKVFVLLALLIYIVFSLIVIRQVKLMGQTLDGKVNVAVKIVAWVHLIVVLFIFLLALIIL